MCFKLLFIDYYIDYTTIIQRVAKKQSFYLNVFFVISVEKDNLFAAYFYFFCYFMSLDKHH